MATPTQLQPANVSAGLDVERCGGTQRLPSLSWQREMRTGGDDTVANPPDSTSATSANPFASGSLLEKKAFLTFAPGLPPSLARVAP